MGILQPSKSLLLNLSVVYATGEESNFDLLTSVQLLSEKAQLPPWFPVNPHMKKQNVFHLWKH